MDRLGTIWPNGSMSELATFCAVVATESFSAAATQLGVSRALVSKRIQELEKRLGVRLINRSTRGFALTEAGELYYRRALETSKQIQRAEREVQLLASSYTGSLRLAAPLVCGYFGTPLLGALINAYPDLEIQLSIIDGPIDLINGGFDAAIHLGERRDSNLICRKVAEGRYSVVASPSYFHKHGLPKTPHDLAGFNCLRQLPIGASTWMFQEENGDPYPVEVSGNLSAGSEFILRQACLMGTGVALLPELLVSNDVETGALQQVLRQHCHFAHNVYLIYPSRDITEKTRALIEALIEFAEQQ